MSPHLDDPDEKPIDLDAPIITTGRTLAALRGELAQAKDDLALANKAMRAALEWISSPDESMVEWSRVNELLKSALRI